MFFKRYFKRFFATSNMLKMFKFVYQINLSTSMAICNTLTRILFAHLNVNDFPAVSAEC